ncbi:MAG: TorF family putative porin [Sphingomonadaceae bacterium]|uniref:TorF family putative porin n=1 Tax=Thermaurantiacus sp. TaxID=2820283 RepID=UPI00298EE0AC|nr:TorF family putative porin [Thermaurantiacus sp.]MCS6986382.1 TorF family putative porin [Sphingomonadaceae bacterium]MDW8414356.1 TorF family putative porin [Thermaurantiacus sp.]
MTLLRCSLALLALTAPAAAAAQDEKPFSVSGSVALVSDYRFRGVSQSNLGAAVQGGLTLNHQSGLYTGFWSSNLAGWGTFGGPNLELDLFGGYKTELAGLDLDAGFTVYTYPGGAKTTTFVELYAKLGGSLGPVNLTGGFFYAPSQKALGNWSNHPDSRPGDKEDNIYISGDASVGIPGAPLTLKAHLGYSDGNPGLGPNGTSIAPTGSYWDWLVGVDLAVGPVTLGIAYVDTDISDTSAAWRRLQPNFSKQPDADKAISNAGVVLSISAAF